MRKLTKIFEKTIRQIFLVFIWIYQKTMSPLLGPSCRFYPSCSEYARLCFQNLPIKKAIVLSLRRIAKCHPANPGGIDEPPIPKRE